VQIYLGMKPLFAVGLSAGMLVFGQQTVPNPTQQNTAVVQLDQTPIFRVNVVARDIRAVNYLHRGGSTKVDFLGTALMPQAKGSAKVESERGVIRVSAEFRDLVQPSTFGPEYLTYVLWAISPDGRPVNLGELTLDSYGTGSDSKINTTSDIQTFGLIVTAEPYYAVTQPSDVVVMENIIRPDTRGVIESVNAHFELLPRGSYTLQGRAPGYHAIVVGKKNPFELYEAENAIELARVAGAPKYAGESFQKAEAALEQAEKYQVQHPGQKPVITMAREAAVRAEDARVVALKRENQEALDNERAAGLARENAEKERAEQARLRAETESKQRAKAEADRLAAEKSKAEALAAVQQAEVARQAALKEKADADAARQAAIQQQQQLALETEKARHAAADADALRQKAEQDQLQLRKQLLEQFNLILQTRDTARGLIVNMSDVLFDTGQYTLRPGAREKLAKVAGIILSHPGLKIKVEGHTDSVGGDDYNMKLSDNRANAVRTYLVGQGVDPSIVASEGFGKSRPVADNSTAAGRQANRRVEMVVSGDIIGSPIGQLSSAPQDRARN
jgi:outer membrane protein OmpA-like peptidoglycan-associated protein